MIQIDKYRDIGREKRHVNRKISNEKHIQIDRDEQRVAEIDKNIL